MSRGNVRALNDMLTRDVGTWSEHERVANILRGSGWLHLLIIVSTRSWNGEDADM
jgi:hypothetical protein